MGNAMEHSYQKSILYHLQVADAKSDESEDLSEYPC